MLERDTWGRADLHTHTVHSDGTARVKEVLEYVAKNRTVDVLAITDHDCIEGSLEALHLAASGNYPLEVVPGVEVSSAHGHVIALWVTRLIPKGLSLNETIAAIHEQNGIAVVAHPCDYFNAGILAIRSRFSLEDVRSAKPDALETFNAAVAFPGANTLAERARKLLQVAEFGGSDAHSKETVGRGFTHFWGRSAEDLRRAFLDRETLADGRHWSLRQYIQIGVRYRRCGYTGDGPVINFLGNREQVTANY